MPFTDFDRTLALHARVSEVIDDIDVQLLWTLQGLGAKALLEARLAALTGERKWARLAYESMSRSFELLSTTEFFPIGLQLGLSGVGWAARLTNRILGSTNRFDLSDVDDIVLDYLSSSESWDGNYDVAGGATGCAVYAFEHPDQRRREEMLEAYVRLLSSRAEPGKHGVLWKTPAPVLPEWQRRIHPDGYINMGLAHGIPGVTAMLARMAVAGISSPELARLLEGSTAECLSELRMDDAANREVVGHFRGDEATGRCAWCYGEPGMAVALGAAGKALGDQRLRGKARTLFHSSVSRTDQSTSQLDDIGLCHGWTGLHVISKYLDSLAPGECAVPDPMQAQFIQKMRDACDAALAEGQLPLFVAPDPEVPPWRDPSFLTGALGVAHAFLDTSSPETKAADLPWADCVLM